MIRRMIAIKIRDSLSGVTISKRFMSEADILVLLELFVKLSDNIVKDNTSVVDKTS